jgi:hypothetical protein
MERPKTEIKIRWRRDFSGEVGDDAWGVSPAQLVLTDPIVLKTLLVCIAFSCKRAKPRAARALTADVPDAYAREVESEPPIYLH